MSPPILTPDAAANPPTQVPGIAGRTLVNHCKGVLVVFARGMFSLLAHLQYEGVLVCMAQAMGEAIAEACWCNDIGHTVALRTKVKEALLHGMKQVPSIPPAQMPGATPDSMQTRQ